MFVGFSSPLVWDMRCNNSSKDSMIILHACPFITSMYSKHTTRIYYTYSACVYAPYRYIHICSIARPLDRSVVRSRDRSVARSLDRWIARPLGRSTARSLDRSIDRSLDRSVTRSHDRAIACLAPLCLGPWLFLDLMRRCHIHIHIYIYRDVYIYIYIYVYM